MAPEPAVAADSPASRVLMSRQPSVEERMETGKALRETVPRSSHGEFVRHRGVDPLRILREQAKTGAAFTVGNLRQWIDQPLARGCQRRCRT